MGATAAHRMPERVADGTHTQVWAWMTNKCRRRMTNKCRRRMTNKCRRRMTEKKDI